MCLRKNRTLNEVSLEEPTPGREPGFPREIADAGEGPAEIYEHQEDQRILSHAMNQLSSELRAALVFRLDDRTLEETAEVLGVRIGTLKPGCFEHGSNSACCSRLVRNSSGIGQSAKRKNVVMWTSIRAFDHGCLARMKRRQGIDRRR
jgi:hypothetical protein